MHAPRNFLFTVLLATLLGAPLAAWATDDSEVAPNRIQTTPPPSTPKAKVTTVPRAHDGTTGSALSPDAGSAMGLGVSIPLGRHKKKHKAQPSDSDSAPQ